MTCISSGPHHPDVAICALNLAVANMQIGRKDDRSRKLLLWALEILRVNEKNSSHESSYYYKESKCKILEALAHLHITRQVGENLPQQVFKPYLKRLL